MAANPIRLLSILTDEEARLGERAAAALRLARWGRWTEPKPPDLPQLAERLLEFWQDLSVNREGDRSLYSARARAGRACQALSPRLPDGPTVYRNFPRPGLIWKRNRPTGLLQVEGPDTWQEGQWVRGRFDVYMPSIHEFHWEYPIERMGVRKDLISVVESDGSRTPLLDWCREHRMFVFCGRCGLDITQEVSRDCPWRKTLHLPRAGPRLVR